LLAPLAGAGAEAPAEAGVEQAEMVKTALLRDIDYLGIAVSQQGNGFQQSHFHTQSRNGVTEVLMEQAIQVATTATKATCQIVDREGQHVVGGKFFKHLDQVVFGTDETNSLSLSGLEFLIENYCGEPEQMATVVEIELRGDARDERVAFRGQGT
jgi:hypothetical protein